jgi:hypothetical protein
MALQTVTEQNLMIAERSSLVAGAERFRTLACAALVGALLASAAGCSLISLKSPEKPLSTRDLNARILTREFSDHFIATVGQTADEISAGTEDPQTRLNALKWKIAAAAKSQRAASQMAPMMSLLDTWALSVQMSDYLATGTGRTLFGAEQSLAMTLAAELAREAEDLARRLTAPDEFAKDERFIADYAHAHPIESLYFARPSIVDAWTGHGLRSIGGRGGSTADVRRDGPGAGGLAGPTGGPGVGSQRRRSANSAATIG